METSILAADNPLARARAAAGLLQADLAARLHITERTISRYEGGDIVPRPLVATALAAAVDYLRNRPADLPPTNPLLDAADQLRADLAAWQAGATSVQPASDAGVRGTK